MYASTYSFHLLSVTISQAIALQLAVGWYVITFQTLQMLLLFVFSACFYIQSYTSLYHLSYLEII